MGNNIRQLLINYRDMQAEINDAYQKINQDDSPMSFDRIEELESGIERVNKFVNSIYSYNLKKAIRIYYIDIDERYQKISWEQVADLVGGGWTSYALKAAIQRIIKKSDTHDTVDTHDTQ